MVLSFHSAVKDPMTVRAIPSLALISLPPSPFSSTMAPRYRNDSTCSKFPPLHVIVIFSHVLLTTITFVFLVFISSPYFLDASFTLSISCWSVSFDVATSTISSAYRKLFIIRPLIVIPIQLSASADSLITFCICMYIYLSIYMYACICMHVYVCICMYVYVCVYVYVCMTRMYVYVFVCMYMYVCIIYQGELSGEMSYPKWKGELSGGNCPTCFWLCPCLFCIKS